LIAAQTGSHLLRAIKKGANMSSIELACHALGKGVS
jgi:hypothetical protein